jgi:D-alanyl-lipoteichoic acid acyltransferase DltB (MBOAT superfamily)
MMPQFHLARCRPDREDLAVGLTLFMAGLFKKVVLADGIAPMIGVLYDQAASGVSVSLIPSWIAAIGFTLQIYFDFAGYTEMALGLARFFGVRFPPNFDSPLKASSIIDFWLRWHMTLTRFLTAYIYNPLVLGLTRRRAARGRPVFGGRNTTVGAFVILLMVPTILTMLVSGVWHGAGYLFILWGLVHGVLLSINHAWRLLAARHWRDRASYERLMKPVGFGLTFSAVAGAMILFRSSTMGSAKSLLNGMLGLNGIVLPESLYDRLGHVPAWVHRASVTATFGGYDSLTTMAWLLGLGFIALALPNTLQLLASYTPALGVSVRRREWGLAGLVPSWRPTLAWGIGVSIIAAIGILRLAGRSEFLYWQF